MPSEHRASIVELISKLKTNGFQVVAVEQSTKSVKLPDFKAKNKCALLLGEETKGITPKLLKLCDITVEIPMLGQKESFNVSVAAGIALYQLSSAKAS